MNENNEKLVTEIKQRIKAGESYEQIAEDLGIPDYDVRNAWFGRKTGPDGYGPDEDQPALLKTFRVRRRQKAVTEFRDLCLIAVKRLGEKSPKTDNWRLFRESLIISYFPNRGSGQYSDQLGTLCVIQEKTLIWDGIDDKPVADFSDAANIVKGWLENANG